MLTLEVKPLKCSEISVVLSRSPDDETCLLVSSPNKALSQSFENLLDDNNFGLVHVRPSPRPSYTFRSFWFKLSRFLSSPQSM